MLALQVYIPPNQTCLHCQQSSRARLWICGTNLTLAPKATLRLGRLFQREQPPSEGLWRTISPNVFRMCRIEWPTVPHLFAIPVPPSELTIFVQVRSYFKIYAQIFAIHLQRSKQLIPEHASRRSVQSGETE